MTRLRGLERGVNFDTAGVSAPKTLAPKSKRAEIKLHPFGCLERRSSIQQAELESFQRRTSFSQGFGRGDCPSSENRARVKTTNEMPQDCRGRFLFGLKCRWRIPPFRRCFRRGGKRSRLLSFHS